MAQTSVAQFASELKVPPSVLLEQLRAAGVEKKQADDSLSESDKSRLLEHLRKMHGSAEQKNKITLTRKQTSEIKKTDASGKYRTVQVEVRKKRVFVRNPAEVAAAALAAETPPPPPPAPTVDPREIELREQEARRQQQLAELQAAELKEKQERERREAEQKVAEQLKAAEAAAAAVAAAAAAPAAQAAAPATTLHAPKPAT